MKVRLRGIREQPLLNPPGRKPLPEWLEVTGKDMDSMRKEMASARHPINGPVHCPLAEMHFFLKELGMPQEITREDRDVILGDFGLLRRGDWNNVFAQLHFLTRSLGLVDRLEEGDKEKMAEGLDFFRKEGMWHEVAAIHHNMRALGVGSEIPREDREGMAGSLENERKEKTHGRLVGLMLWHMKGAGLNPKVTEHDRRLMKIGLERARQIGRGDSIAEMHYINRLIRDDDAPDYRAQIPPLKRFGG